MNKPKVTVIIPVYNVEQYLREAVDSVLHQTFTDFEIILVDDGSTDTSGKICDEYAVADSRVRVIHKVNGGLSSARNAGMDIMHGEYLMFLDSDDLYSHNQLIESLIEIANNHSDIDVIQFRNVSFKNEPPLIELPDTPKIKIIVDNESVFISFREWEITHTCCDKLYKTSFLTKGDRFPLGLYYEDEYFICNLINHSPQILITNIVGYLVRERINSITRPTHFNLKLYVDHVLVYCHLLQIGKVRSDERFLRTYFNAALINYKKAYISGWDNLDQIKESALTLKSNAPSLIFLTKEKVSIKEFINVLITKVFGLSIIHPLLSLLKLRGVLYQRMSVRKTQSHHRDC